MIRFGTSGGSQTGEAATGLPRWFLVFPFFVSAVFFLSALFVFFAPVPLLLSYFRSGRLFAILALISNAALVAIFSGPLSAALYVITIGSSALVMGELLTRRRSLEVVTLGTLASALFLGMVGLGLYAQIHQLNPVNEVITQAQLAVDQFADSVGADSLSRSGVVPSDPVAQEAWKEEVLRELPSAGVILFLALVWANLLIVLRLNPSGIREGMGLSADFTRRWRAPEWLVWPALICGAVLIFGSGLSVDIAQNVFRILMAVYVVQGLSILAFIFDVWGIHGLLRLIGMSLAILVMLPLVLSLGFFDLWFDFRAKFRQT